MPGRLPQPAGGGGTPWYTADQKTNNVLSHELAHACNVKHHGDRKEFIVKAEYLDDEVDAGGKVPHPKGSAITYPGSGAGWMFGFSEGGSYSSGDTHCYMTYRINFIEASADSIGGLGNPMLALWNASTSSV